MWRRRLPISGRGREGQDAGRWNARLRSVRVHVRVLYPADRRQSVRPPRRLDPAVRRIHQLHDLGDVRLLQAAARLADHHRQRPGNRLRSDHCIDCTLLNGDFRHGRCGRLSDPWRSGNAHNEKAAVGFPRQRLFFFVRFGGGQTALRSFGVSCEMRRMRSKGMPSNA